MALEERPQLKKLVRILKNTYDERFASFCRILKGNMEAFALNLRQNGIIGDDIFEKKEYSTMVSQFKAGLDFKRDWKAVEQHCQKFLDSLSDSGPQPQEAAEQLKESWQRAVLREMGMTFLPVEVTRTDPSIPGQDHPIEDPFSSVCHHTLDLNDHNQVFDACKEFSSNWKFIGSTLGLKINTLAAIKKDCDDVREMMFEMLATWLRRENEEQSLPTWNLLLTTLTEYDRTEAEKIARKFVCKHPPC